MEYRQVTILNFSELNKHWSTLRNDYAIKDFMDKR